MNQYVSKSLNHHICKSILTDRLIQILDFGEVSTDRQVLSRVTRKVLSNSKHNLLSSDTSIFQIISESETTLSFRRAETWLRLVNNFEFEDIYQLPNGAENGGYPPTQNGDIRSLFWLFSLMALQN